MKSHRQVAWMYALVLGVAVGVAFGCAKEPEVGTTTPAGATTAARQPTPGPTPSARPAEVAVTERPAPREDTLARTPAGGTQPPGGAGASPLNDVFFDYDKALITDEARRALSEDTAWLKANPQAAITVEGHCDERGTSEYNLALGDRRARAVREYLVAAGIDGNRIRTISFGKERPFVLGHDESAWRQNRRAHFVVSGR